MEDLTEAEAVCGELVDTASATMWQHAPTGWLMAFLHALGKVNYLRDFGLGLKVTNLIKSLTT